MAESDKHVAPAEGPSLMTRVAYKLFVIDDSARDARLLERLLHQSEEAAFEITHVTSAQAGLEAIENSAYDEATTTAARVQELAAMVSQLQQQLGA